MYGPQVFDTELPRSRETKTECPRFQTYNADELSRKRNSHAEAVVNDSPSLSQSGNLRSARTQNSSAYNISGSAHAIFGNIYTHVHVHTLSGVSEIIPNSLAWLKTLVRGQSTSAELGESSSKDSLSTNGRAAWRRVRKAQQKLGKDPESLISELEAELNKQGKPATSRQLNQSCDVDHEDRSSKARERLAEDLGESTSISEASISQRSWEVSSFVGLREKDQEPDKAGSSTAEEPLLQTRLQIARLDPSKVSQHERHVIGIGKSLDRCYLPTATLSHVDTRGDASTSLSRSASDTSRQLKQIHIPLRKGSKHTFLAMSKRKLALVTSNLPDFLHSLIEKIKKLAAVANDGKRVDLVLGSREHIAAILEDYGSEWGIKWAEIAVAVFYCMASSSTTERNWDTSSGIVISCLSHRRLQMSHRRLDQNLSTNCRRFAEKLNHGDILAKFQLFERQVDAIYDIPSSARIKVIVLTERTPGGAQIAHTYLGRSVTRTEARRDTESQSRSRFEWTEYRLGIDSGQRHTAGYTSFLVLAFL